jgi:hypothetical protein
MPVIRELPANYHRLPASHKSTYSIQHTLENLGFEPLTASTAIDCVLGPDPGRVLEHWEDEPLVGPADECEPPSADQHFEPSPEDWQDYLSWSDRLDAMDLISAEIEARMASDYDDLMERATMLTEGDIRAAGLAV